MVKSPPAISTTTNNSKTNKVKKPSDPIHDETGYFIAGDMSENEYSSSTSIEENQNSAHGYFCLNDDDSSNEDDSNAIRKNYDFKKNYFLLKKKMKALILIGHIVYCCTQLVSNYYILKRLTIVITAQKKNYFQ